MENLQTAIAATPSATTFQAALSTERSARRPAFFHTIARLGIQAAEALEHAHQLGIVHRDIKPANLLVDDQGKLWVTDFGLAHCQSQAGLTMSGDLVGTLRYMSPEQALAQRVGVDERTDIYSLGATLYELLTLEPVFVGSDRQELLRQIAFEEPKAARRHNKSIPAELETIVLKALEKNPADRYATAKELGEDLERFAKDEPIRARRPPLTRRLKGWCRRHKPLVTGVVVLVMTALFLGGGLFWQQERQRVAVEQAVAEDLKEAKSWQEKEVWAKALQALERAAGRLEGSAPSPLKEEVDKRRQEAALIARLEEAHMKATSKRFYGQPDFAGADLAYGKAFAVHGLDVTTLKAEEIVRSIKDSPIQTQLVAALDYWAYVKDNLRGGSGEPLRAIANLADDDPWRRQLRDPRVAKSLDTLEALAAGKDILAQPPTNLLLLSYLFEGVAGSDASARQRAMTAEENLLRRAQVRYPADFRIAMALASKFKFLPDGAFAPDTINFLRVAVAIQPQVGDNYVFPGIMLGQQQKWAEAEVAFKRAIDLNPKDDHAYFFFGNFLAARGRLCESVDAYRKAIDCKPEALSMALCDGACAAARAGCGEKDAAKLDAMERARLREQARAWLKEALVIWRSNLDKSTDKGRANVGGQMQEWLQERDFEGVRGAAGMAKLIVAERREWKKLWEEVNELWKRATEAK